MEKSAIFAQILTDRMEQDKESQRAAVVAARAKNVGVGSSSAATMPGGKSNRGNGKSVSSGGRKRARVESGYESEGESSSKRRKMADEPLHLTKEEEEEIPILPQPGLVTGARMKPYQLEGLQWMTSLHSNGISGILGMSYISSCLFDQN